MRRCAVSRSITGERAIREREASDSLRLGRICAPVRMLRNNVGFTLGAVLSSIGIGLVSTAFSSLTQNVPTLPLRIPENSCGSKMIFSAMQLLAFRDRVTSSLA